MVHPLIFTAGAAVMLTILKIDRDCCLKIHITKTSTNQKIIYCSDGSRPNHRGSCKHRGCGILCGCTPSVCRKPSEVIFTSTDLVQCISKDDYQLFFLAVSPRKGVILRDSYNNPTMEFDEIYDRIPYRLKDIDNIDSYNLCVVVTHLYNNSYQKEFELLRRQIRAMR